MIWRTGAEAGQREPWDDRTLTKNTKLYLSEDMVETIAKNMKLAAPAPAQQSWARDLIDKNFESGVIDEAEKKALYEKTETFQGCREYLNLNPEAWTADANVSRQKLMETKTLRDFVSIFEAYGKAQYKKATLDLNVLSEDHNVRLRESRQALKASTLNRTPLPTVQENKITVAEDKQTPVLETPKLSPLAQAVV